jgi:hypothetical protein
MYLQLPRDVAPVGDDRVDADEQVVGYFLVGHSLDKADHYIAFTL